jgi:hypothetical protein
VEPVPYAGVATPNDAVMTGSASWGFLVGGIVLRLIGACTLVECRRPMAEVLQGGFDGWGQMDFGFGCACLIVFGYVAWGLLLVIRGPRFLGRPLRRAAVASIEGAEWSVVVLSAAGAVIVLWSMEPLLGLFSAHRLVGALPTTIGQLALGLFLFLFSGRLSSSLPVADRR